MRVCCQETKGRTWKIETLRRSLKKVFTDSNYVYGFVQMPMFFKTKNYWTSKKYITVQIWYAKVV